MTKTQYYTATSVDGFIAGADNSLEWLFTVERGGPGRFNEFFREVKAMWWHSAYHRVAARGLTLVKP